MPQPATPTHLIGSTEAAELLGISRWTLARRVRDGRITPVRKLPGDTGAYLFDPDTIREHVA